MLKDDRNPGALAALPDEALIEAVQRQTFRYFWDGADAASGLALDRRTLVGLTGEDRADERVAIGGSGFGVMALIVAVERGWVTRDAALDRLRRMLVALFRATRFHGAYPHFMDGASGRAIPMSPKDDAGDLVETSFLVMGLLCARQYFSEDTAAERRLRSDIDTLWHDVEWDWFTRGGRDVLYWHWSPNHGWAMNHPVRGWDECLMTYLLAAAAPRHAIDPRVYHSGYAAGRGFVNGRSYYGIELPLGMPYGGPLFFTHYSFCGLHPRGLKDRYADYWDLNCRHLRINRAHCVVNPHGHRGYGETCWGLTASDDPDGYLAHAPDIDNGTISPTAALASLPYAPAEVMQVLRHFLTVHGARLWRDYGFVDAFCEQRDWFAETYLAIDQGPIVVMMENHRTGLLWKLFMSVPEVQAGLRALDFSSPHLGAPAP
ncbi:glucoamylase family protein [Variovorax sp. J22R115]|uniref:glucoamylase family protein n=1 Tax=Variovorax sp. J22R115 TaxID=3053509 RepID=UPI0025772828|nr:glucoamylase family protein [Variovorax sp. J22R115]MDM0047592.1 glucoamylase family protein [Variovorax sp. J22R115]